MKEKRLKEIRLSTDNLEVRNDEQEESKMIIEGYPVIFGKEMLMDNGEQQWMEQIDRHAFDEADVSDVALKYNHNDNVFILARTRNGSLQLRFDDKGIFIHAELINTTTNRDVYEMVKAELLKEGSFAFTVVDEDVYRDANNVIHRNITKIGKLFDVAICPNGAYGELTEIYARSYSLLENKINKMEISNSIKILKLRNKNKLKLMEARNERFNKC